MALFNLTRWPSALLFILAGSTTVLFAFVTVNLFSQAMASAKFLREFGTEAIRHGALAQVIELVLWGGLALFCWLTFKVCEHELVERYLRWGRASVTHDTPPRAETDRRTSQERVR